MEHEHVINIKNFDGPLDLLLSLIKDKQMDIFDIDLAELATSYLKLIDTLKESDIDLASEYLVMAATMLQIKARMLLETPEAQAEVEQEKENILQQLAEYQRFKKISGDLREREALRDQIFIKAVSDYSDYKYDIDETRLDGHSDVIRIIINLRKMFERVNAFKMRQTTIEKFNLSPADRRIELINLFKRKSNITFEDIFSVPSMNHFVVTMLTVLDMSRRQEIILSQDYQYGDITIKKGIFHE